MPRTVSGGVTDGPARPDAMSVRKIVRTVVTDVGIPYAAYLILSQVGVRDVFALAAAGGLSAVQVAVTFVRRRHVSALAVLILTRFGVGVAAALLTGDAQMVLIKDSVITGAVGVLALGSLALRRPLTYYINRDFVTNTRSWDDTWSRSQRFRRANRLTTLVWGVGLIVESAVRIFCVFLLPLDIAVIASPSLGAVAVLALIAWTQWYTGITRRAAQPSPQ